MWEAKYKANYITEEKQKQIQTFFDYFLANHAIIEQKIVARDKSFVKEFEQELSQVVGKNGLRFNFFYLEGYFEVVLYYGRDDYLLTIFTEIAEKKRNYKLQNWRFVLQK